MLILADETKHKGFPWVTASLVVANVLVFLLQIAIGDPFTRGFALVPAEIVTGKDLVKPAPMKLKVPYRDHFPGPTYGKVRYIEETVMVPQARGPRPVQLTLLTSMFMHGGWIHLIGNMWFLLIFGRNVELAMGRQLFIFFYFTCGLVSGFADVLVDPHSVVPYLGASGAISGVMGAYFFIFPLNRVKVLISWYVVELPSFVVVGLWFLMQYLSTVSAVTSGQIHTGVAYWSHIGGFLTGIAFILTTLAILKWQAKREETEAVAEGEAALAGIAVEETEADRLFARAAGEKSEAITADPFTTFLPAEPEKKEPVTTFRAQ